VRHQSSRTYGSPSGRSMLVSGRDCVRHLQVSWFGCNRRFPVPAMHACGAGRPFGSRIAEGNRHSRRAASLNRMVDPRDHGKVRRAMKNAFRGEKTLDLEHSRLEPFILVGSLRRANTDVERSRSALLREPTSGRIAKAIAFAGGPGGKAPGGVEGSALAPFHPQNNSNPLTVVSSERKRRRPIQGGRRRGGA
jgi:hypothetical protein